MASVQGLYMVLAESHWPLGGGGEQAVEPPEATLLGFLVLK